MSQVQAGSQGNSSDLGVVAMNVLEGTARSSLPMRKRKQEENTGTLLQSIEKTARSEDPYVLMSESGALSASTSVGNSDSSVNLDGLKPLKRPPMSKAREIRLEQNRKAARESRKRKKIMVEELQRSVIFFTRANTTLKQQNEELERHLLQAQSKAQGLDIGQNLPVADASSNASTSVTNDISSNLTSGVQTQEINAVVPPTAEAANQVSQAPQAATAQTQQVQNLSTLTTNTQALSEAQAAATQAMFESQGFSPAAARSAAQTFVLAPASATNAQNNTSVLNGGMQLMSFATANSNAAANTNQLPFFVTLAPVQLQSQNTPQLAMMANPAAGNMNMGQMFGMQMPSVFPTMVGNNAAMNGANIPMMQLQTMSNGSFVLQPSVNTGSTSNGESNQVTSQTNNVNQKQDDL